MRIYKPKTKGHSLVLVRFSAARLRGPERGLVTERYLIHPSAEGVSVQLLGKSHHTALKIPSDIKGGPEAAGTLSFLSWYIHSSDLKYTAEINCGAE